MAKTSADRKALINMIVNFMCQPDLATGCPDIWLNIMTLTAE